MDSKKKKKKQTEKLGNWWEELLNKANSFKCKKVLKTDSY